MRAWKFKGIVLVAAMLAASSSLAREIGPTDWPLERIVSNLEAELAKAKNDPQLNYSLGRAHGFAFALESSSLSMQGSSWVRDLEFQPRRNPTRPRPSDSELLDHLASGVKHLSLACEQPAKDWRGRYELTLAWLLETGAHLASRVDTAKLFYLTPLEPNDIDIQAIRDAIVGSQNRETFEKLLRPPLLDKAVRYCAQRRVSGVAVQQTAIDDLLRRFWVDQSIEHYRRALECALGAAEENVWFDRAVAKEGIEGYVRLVQQRGYRDEAERASVEELQKRANEFLAKPSEGQPISPILVAVDDCKTLDELIAPNLTVPFDLDGDGVDELWPWIAPGTGWLVWDPHHRGEITSGQQLFGSASAWLFFQDGYRVLDALDDDRNGKLEGAELDGIAVWFDRNTNGVSDRGEVIPVQQLGIAALATQSTLTLGASPANLCGLEMADGRVLPTYDWVLAPVAQP